MAFLLIEIVVKVATEHLVVLGGDLGIVHGRGHDLAPLPHQRHLSKGHLPTKQYEYKTRRNNHLFAFLCLEVGCHAFFEGVACAVEARFDRSKRNARDLGDMFVGQKLDIA